MKIIVNRVALLQALQMAASIAQPRTPKPVLGCVKLAAVGKELIVTATDMELALQYAITQVDIKAPGMALLNATKLLEIVNNSPDETLAINTKEEKTDITGEDSQYRLLGFNPEEAPPISSFEGTPDFVLAAGNLKKLLDRSRFAAAREVTRYAINGVLVERKGKKICLVATDGHRLAQTRDELESAEGRDLSAVIPIKAINLIERLLTDPEQNVALQFKENKVFAQITSELGVAATMSSTLVEGTFPPYNDVIPKDCDKKAVLDREKFQSAVRRAATLSNEESKGVRLGFAPGKLSISSRTAEVGEANIDLAADYNGEAVDMGFNPAYILDALKVGDETTVIFEFKSPNKPGLIKIGPNFQYVVMPVTLNS
ncbi:MAG: DNA polymerase III subunit beta [Phycisphaerae bacterium]